MIDQPASRTDLENAVDRLEARISAVQTRLIWYMIGIAFTISGVIIISWIVWFWFNWMTIADIRTC